MLTLLHFPQWQGGAKIRQLQPASAHLRAQLVTHFEAPPPVLEVPIQPYAERTVEANIAYRSTVLTQLREAQALIDNAAPSQVITVGGDCGIETIPVGYLNAQSNGQMALVWIDAHGDLNTPESSPSKHYHGMGLRTLFGEGDPEFVDLVPKTLHPDQVFMIGTRELDAPEQEFIEARGIFSTSGLDLNDLVQRIRNRGYARVYIHFDLDGLDPQPFSYMSFPTPNGLSIEQVAQAVETLNQQFEVVGMSITEYGSETGEGLVLLDPILEQVAAINHD